MYLHIKNLTKVLQIILLYISFLGKVMLESRIQTDTVYQRQQVKYTLVC